jgi:hypothetical protein
VVGDIEGAAIPALDKMLFNLSFWEFLMLACRLSRNKRLFVSASIVYLQELAIVQNIQKSIERKEK